MSLSPLDPSISSQETGENEADKTNFLDKAKNAMGGVLGKVCGFADNHPDPTIRKVRRVFIYSMAILLVCLVVWMFAGSNGVMGQVGNAFTGKGFDVSALNWGEEFFSNSSMTTVMMVGAATAGVGIGVSLILQELISKKYQRSVSKVTAVMLPLLMLAAGGCLLGAGIINRGIISTTSLSNYATLGMALMGGSFIMGGVALTSSPREDFLFQYNKPIEASKSTARDSADRSQRTRAATRELAQISSFEDAEELESVRESSLERELQVESLSD